MTPNIAIDPFFDDEVEGFKPNAVAGVPAYEKHYRDPAQERMEDGTPLMQFIGQGPKGVGSGLIIPRATAGGVPMGINPNRISDLEVCIDPHMPGASAKVRLADLHQDLMSQSIEEARELVPDNATPARHRRRASTAMRLAAAHAAAGDVPRREPELAQATTPVRRVTTGSRQVATRPAVAVAPVTAGAPVHSFTAAPLTGPQTAAPVPFGSPPLTRSTLLSHFAPPAAAGGPPPPPPFLTPTVAAVQTAPRPDVHIEFEIEQFGHIDAYYHDVQYEPDNGRIMLVYNREFVGGTKWFPPMPSEKPVNIAMTDKTRPQMRGVVCLVAHSGNQYVYGNLEFCVLNILQVGQLTEDASLPAG